MTFYPVLCIGAVLWDVIGRSAKPMAHGADVPGRIRHEPGGVALNVAAALAARGQAAALLGVVGLDPEGDALLAAVREMGVDTDWIRRDGRVPTDVYMVVEDPRGLIAAIADAHSLESAGEAVLAPLRNGRLGSAESPWKGAIVVDGNLTTEQLTAIASDAAFAAADLRAVPASPGKAERLAPLIGLPNVTLYLNKSEAETLAGHPCSDASEAAAAVVARGATRVLVTDGAHPAVCAVQGGEIITCQPPEVDLVHVTGAGDCFLAAHLVAEAGGASREAALVAAVEAAAAHVSGR